MRILIKKRDRRLFLFDGEQEMLSCPIALGRAPNGPKRREGDGRTPEGVYAVCLVKEKGKYGRSLGLSYPGVADAKAALARGEIDLATYRAVVQAHLNSRRPPWGTPMGGEIYIHEGGSRGDWTQGCIAINTSDMDRLFPLRKRIDKVEILP